MDIERRQFFKKMVSNTLNTVVQEIDNHVEERAKHWMRPPFAIAEMPFLLACTRCDACMNACQYNIIFPLPAGTGPTSAATPAMDILNHGCHLCTDWPCVNACETGALKLDKEDGVLPKLAIVEININECLPYQGPECGACADSCPVQAAIQWDMARPMIQNESCPGCGLCREACIMEPKAISIRVNTENLEKT